VQWQDERGDWHDVTGWQGILDGVLKIDQLDYGTKLWWVEKEDTGSGPFRWLVYRRGAVGSTTSGVSVSSAPFNLPAIGQFATVDIALREPTRLAPQVVVARLAGLPSCKNGYGCDCAQAQQAWPDMDVRLQIAMSRALCEPMSYKDDRP